MQAPVPINAHDDNVTLLVHELHQAAPNMGRRKLADVLARAGLCLAASTVRRMLEKTPPTAPKPPPNLHKQKSEREQPRVVTAKYPHHLWHVDLTTTAIGTSGSGFWVPWWPFALILRWVVSWHIAVVLDHFSRALVAFSVFRKEPTATEMCAFLDRAVIRAQCTPRYIVSDQGSQFQSEYRAWCRRNGIRPRFGAVGKHGSIAVIERFILSLKTECLRCICVPFAQSKMLAELAAYQLWYNGSRPHEALGGATPVERLEGRDARRERPHFEPRARYPLARGDPAARRCGRLELVVTHVRGRAHLPAIELCEAA